MTEETTQTLRSYGDACGVARALDLVGERWALLIVRELVLGPKRFTDLRTGLAHASPNVLAQRLRELERAGVVWRRKLGPPVGSWVYDLTGWGRELQPVILQLGRWGSRAPRPAGDAPMSVDSLVLHLLARFDPQAARALSASFELRLGDDRFLIQVAAGRIDVGRVGLGGGDVEPPDATIVADPETFESVLTGRRSLGEVRGSGRLELMGDAAAAERLLESLPMHRPETAPETVA